MKVDRNLRGHAEAVAARHVYGREYAAQNGGQMDFWDGLSEVRKDDIREMVDNILRAAKEHGRARHEG